MRLECKKYTWASTVLAEERNFFSSTTPTLTQSVDLKDYLIRYTLGDTEYSFEDISDTDNILYSEASNFALRCKNNLSAPGGDQLQDFFEIYLTNSFTKWKLNFYDDSNNLIYSGIIYKDGVKFPNRKEDNITISVIGYEKEFKDYFVNKPMESPDIFGNTGMFNLNGLKVFIFKEVIKKNFPLVSFKFETVLNDFLSKWYVAESPYTYHPNNSIINSENTLHIKTGYNAYRQDGVNKFAFFDGLLKSMGWVWYFYLGMLYIKRRSDDALSTYTIDHTATAITHSIENRLQTYQADSVIIDDGEYFDNGNKRLGGLTIPTTPESEQYNLAGSGKRFYSDSVPYWNYQRPFRRIEFRGPNYQLQYGNWNFVRLNSSNDYGDTYEKIQMPAFNVHNFTKSLYTYQNFKTLKISPVINSINNSGGFDINNPRADSGAYYGNGNFYKLAMGTLTNTQILYRGNPGNCMIYYDASTGIYMNYEEYSNTAEFRNNFKKFLRTNVQTILEIEVKALITNPFTNVVITNYPYATNINNSVLSLQRLSFNYRTGRSRLTLQKI